MNTIGENIRTIRERKNITQEKMAKHFNITQSNYGRLEKDDNRISVTRLLKIAKILDVSPFELMIIQ